MSDEKNTVPQPTPEETLNPIRLASLPMGFVDQDVAGAQAAHNELHANLTPSQAAIIAEADKAIREVESIFEGPTDVTLVNRLLREAGLLEVSAEESILAAKAFVQMKYNEYFVVQGKAFIKTVDNKIQEASKYVSRLETSTLKSYQETVASVKARVKAEDELLKHAAITARGFWGRLKFAFTGK